MILLVPGDSEYSVLPVLLKSANVNARAHKTKSVSYDVRNNQAIVSQKVYRQVEAAFEENPTRVILIFDREDASVCPGEFALKVKSLILENTRLTTSAISKFAVVCADHSVENWILADHNIFKSNLFKRDLSGRIGNRSDCKKAISIIQEGFGRRKKYQKVRHLKALANYFNLSDSQVRKRSPSLDKFLRECGL